MPAGCISGQSVSYLCKFLQGPVLLRASPHAAIPHLVGLDHRHSAASVIRIALDLMIAAVISLKCHASQVL